MSEWQEINEIIKNPVVLTRRDSFAMAAMQGLLASMTAFDPHVAYVAQVSVEYATALIAELDKET